MNDVLQRENSSGRASSVDPSDSETVYTKDNVAIHPTQYASERISGRLRLVKQGPSLFMETMATKI
ncbi:hypothetical protein QJS10_CPB17g02393 [Acorus calamus]|uniref:Uncharacterized protein n=1 Tax=Acorus calamus TaxID=4465 RepID=A0AAV9CVN7_ACOCL|nr:hypothetical protein QJS10_CPB17g02393 [Acorus calamus]